MADLKKGARITGASRDKLAAQVTKKYEGGASIRELAESTGRSYGFVHRLLSENGAAMRGRGGATRSRGVRAVGGTATSTAASTHSPARPLSSAGVGRARLHSVS